MRDEQSMKITSEEDGCMLDQIIKTREPFDNGFTLIFDKEKMTIKKSYFIMPGREKWSKFGIWGEHIKKYLKKIK